jgi:hypothetical protein
MPNRVSTASRRKHLGPEKAALARQGVEMYFAPADLARRQEMADRLLADPGLLLKQLSKRALHLR